jgi:uncharacterized protein YbjT (DUF2867 family)
MIKARTRVTSAAGRTGREAVRLLLEKGYSVRAFVHRDDGRAAALRDLGAEIFVGDLFDFRDLQTALKDVQRAYHCPPFAQNLLHNTMLFCLAAEDAGLEVLALLSGWNTHESHPSTLTREHWIANNIARWMPTVDVIHVNPGLFAFAYLLTLPVTAKLGLLPLPYGIGKNAPVSARDIARVVASVLDDPARHVGKSYRPTGPALLDPDQIAATVGKVIGRKVRYRNVPFKMMAKAAKAQGFSTFDTANLRYYAQELAAGAFAIGGATTHVEEVTGAPAESFEETVRRYHANPELIAPGMSHMSTIGALRFMAKMMLTPAPDLDAFEAQRGFPKLGNPLLAHENPAWVSDAEKRQLHLLKPAHTSETMHDLAS